MKKYLYIIFTITAFTSCNKWLDVTPETQVSDDELFKTEAGFEEALNGVYTNCLNAGGYGVEMTIGFPEVLAQNYSLDANDNFGYRQTSLYNYKDLSFIGRKDEAWRLLYASITNANLLLEKLEKNRSVLSDMKYNLIKGEALAARAYFHFDALRLFGPSFITEPAAKAIPYVTTFSNKVTGLATVTEALTKMEQDLLASKALLKPVDPIVTAAYKVGYPGDTAQKELASKELFLQNRRHRLNYYAVCGTLARVYLYMDKKQEALSNALEVIEAKKFPWTKTADFIEPDAEKKDRIMYNELVFCFYDVPQQSSYAGRFVAGITGLHIDADGGNSLYETGGVGAEDLRFKQWLKLVNNISGNWFEVQKYLFEKETNRHPLVAPAIRLSEMYYIAAECTWDADQAKALGYVNTVRFNRGIGATLNVSSKEQFLTELLKEARKEFYAEGQIFYMYKRLNRGIAAQNGITIPASKSIFVLPLPNDELEYGQR